MYLLDEMVDMGLKKGQKWPTPAHRVVARRLVIGNPVVRTMDALTEIVQGVRRIPKTEIKTVTMEGLMRYGINLLAAP